MNSYASPRHWFVPDLVCTSTTAPYPRPNSALYVLVMTWNSLIVESAAPCRFWFSDESSLLTPLIWNVAPRVPVPLKLIDDPDEAVGLFCPHVGFSWKPGKISASDRKLPGLSRRLVDDLLGRERPFHFGVRRVDRAATRRRP